MKGKKILVVEDDINISKLVCYNLEKEGFKCRAVYSGKDAIQELSRNKYDLVVLDIMLPEVNGLDICRKIKNDKKTASTKVLMLTAKGEELDRVVGFELGADDYVVKPFSPRELVLRVIAILKRNNLDTEAEVLSYKGIKVDHNAHSVSIDGKEVDFTAMEFKLLSLLISNKGMVQTRELLLDKVWGMSSDVTTRTVDTHIKKIRQKMGKYCDDITTIRGVGYKLSDEDKMG